MQSADFAAIYPGSLVPTVRNCVAFVPDDLSPALEPSDKIRIANERALLALGELRAIIPTLPNSQLISRPFLRREALLSSRIEGTNTEMEGLYLFETTKSEKRPSPDDPEDIQDVREVANYVSALEHGLSSLSQLPVCNRLLKDMHQILLRDVHRDRGRYLSPGKFRRGQAYVGSGDIVSARYVAPPHDCVEDLMAKLERYINSPANLPTLANIALIHYQFEAIHPFSDGNGRLGRLLISLLLSSLLILPEPLLYISAYFERNKDQYIDRLWEVSRCGAWNNWILFFLQGVKHEALDATERARKLLEMREKYRTQFQSDSSGGSLLTLVDALFLWPVMTVNRATTILEMTYQGAKKNVDKLVGKGVLVEVTGNYRNRVFLARPIVQLLS